MKKYQFPGSWTIRKISDLFRVETGTTPSTKRRDYWEHGTVNWITPADMSKLTSTIKIKGSERRITEKGLTETNLTLMPKNSLIISTRAPVGYVAVVENETTFNQGCKGLIPRNWDEIDTSFYCYYLLSKKRALENRSGGCTFKELSKKMLESFYIPKAPIKEQHAIAEILSTVDDAIGKVEEAIVRTGWLKTGLMQSLLSRGVGHTQFKETKVGRVPVGWDVVKLGENSKTYAGGTPSRKNPAFYGGDVPWVKSGEVNQGYIYQTEERITKAGLNNSSAKMVPKNTVLMAMYGATAGQAGILKIDATTNQAVLAICPQDNEFDYRFMYYLLSSKIKRLIAKTQGTGQPNLSKNLIDSLKIPIPSTIKEQQKIAEILSTVDIKIELEQKRKTRLERIKQGLMNELLTGKKRVKNLETFNYRYLGSIPSSPTPYGSVRETSLNDFN